MRTVNPTGSRDHFASPATTTCFWATARISSSTSACRLGWSAEGAETGPHQAPTRSTAGHGSGLHLVEKPCAADFFKRWFRHELVQRWRNYLAVEPNDIRTVFQTVMWPRGCLVVQALKSPVADVLRFGIRAELDELSVVERAYAFFVGTGSRGCSCASQRRMTGGPRPLIDCLAGRLRPRLWPDSATRQPPQLATRHRPGELTSPAM